MFSGSTFKLQNSFTDESKSRNPIYQDLLAHRVTRQQLDNFISQLVKVRIIEYHGTSCVSYDPVTEMDEIDDLIYSCRHNKTNVQKPYGNAALSCAIELNNIEIVKALLRAGANPNTDYVSDDILYSILHSNQSRNLDPISLGLQRGVCDALRYAISLNAIEIVQALLEAGANPNASFKFGSVKFGSALMMALLPDSNVKQEILTLLLNAPEIDIYDMCGIESVLELSVFLCTQGNTTTILRLLEADSNLALCTAETKSEIANTIARASHHDPYLLSQDNVRCIQEQSKKTHLAVCQSLKAVYSTTAEETNDWHNTINEACGFTTGQPLGAIVLSYLFKRKPDSLKLMELRYGNNEEKKLDGNKQNNKKRTCCSVI